MKSLKLKALILALAVATVSSIGVLAHSESTDNPDVKNTDLLNCTEEGLYCPTGLGNITLAKKLYNLKKPKLTPPPKPVVVSTKPQSTTVTYSVTTRGVVTANLAQFKSYANATLNDNRGWGPGLGIKFVEVNSGGQFVLVLAAANQMTSFWNGCSNQYSCQVGSYVIINQDRWLGATPSWNNAGGSLRDYQHMVVNHETGHWLGHGHASCPSSGKSAAVMQQQSISLQGCKFNPWPLQSEMWSTRLGIS